MQTTNGGHRKLLVGMHDGVCAVTSPDGGRSWIQGDVTPLAHAASRLSVSPADPRRAYLAAYEAGVYRTDDGGATWVRLPKYPPAYAHSVQVYPDDPQQVLVGSEPAGIFRSGDGGETWEECAGFQEVPESEEWFFHSDTRYSHVRDLRMSPGDPSRLYAGIEVGGVVRSLDGGSSWEQLRGTDADVHYINISGAMPERVYVATAAGPYGSDDAGLTWKPLMGGLQSTYSVHIVAAPNDADLVLLSVSRSFRRESAQLYRSASGGSQWQVVEGVGSEDDMVVAMDWDQAEPRRVYAGTDRGRLYVSEDRGESWGELPLRLPSVSVGALTVTE